MRKMIAFKGRLGWKPSTYYFTSGKGRTRSRKMYVNLFSKQDEPCGKPASVQKVVGIGAKLRCSGSPLAAKPDNLQKQILGSSCQTGWHLDVERFHRKQQAQRSDLTSGRTAKRNGIPKNESNKIWKEMERDKNEVAQDGMESAASPLRGESCLAKWTKQRGHATSESRE